MPRFDTCTPKMIIVCCHHRHHNHYYISLYITIYHCISLCIIYIYVFYLTVYHCISYVYICQSRSLSMYHHDVAWNISATDRGWSPRSFWCPAGGQHPTRNPRGGGRHQRATRRRNAGLGFPVAYSNQNRGMHRTIYGKPDPDVEQLWNTWKIWETPSNYHWKILETSFGIFWGLLYQQNVEKKANNIQPVYLWLAVSIFLNATWKDRMLPYDFGSNKSSLCFEHVSCFDGGSWWNSWWKLLCDDYFGPRSILIWNPLRQHLLDFEPALARRVWGGLGVWFLPCSAG